VWLPPTGSPASASKSRTWLIVVIVIVGLLVLFVPAIDVVSREHHHAQAAATQVPGLTGPQAQTPVTPPVAPLPAQPAPTTSARPGHPVFIPTPAPPAGYEGDASVFVAKGVGSAVTPTFTLHGGPVSGGMQQNGQGAYFYLDRVGAKPSTTPTEVCNNGCASGGWGTNTTVTPGKYRLRVVTAKGTPWAFDLTERLIAKLSVQVQQTPLGTTFDAHGLGSSVTKTFRIERSPGKSGVITLSGGFTCDGAVLFTLEPVGSTPGKALTTPATSGSGGLSLQVPGPGTYRLRIQTSASWQFQFASS
jgi:hypothetical protein